ncbi:MAG: hypothetical protein ACJA0G_001933 [Kangiellaceae bacterium]|jgi:hypothetical protein
MYDLVGDIHGFDGPFVALLKKLGYADIEGVWQHPTRILISLGDLVDRGPGQKKVVDILKNMQQHGKAIVIMGNHEFYAVAWHLKGPNGKPLRPHSEKNYNEHRAFLEQASQGSPWYIDAINWFKTLPLFFETDDIRCIHAAWHEEHLDTLKAYTNKAGVIKPSVWENPSEVDMRFYKSLEYCINGPKLNLPEGAFFIDSNNQKRVKIRLKWWDLTKNATYRNACTSVPNPEQLPDEPIALSSLPAIHGNKPIFFGHYWMQGTPQLMKDNIACLDWSVVQKDGRLAAYRFDAEQVLDANKLVWV